MEKMKGVENCMRYGLIYEKTDFQNMEMTYSVDMVRYAFAFDKTACYSLSKDMQHLYDYLSDKIRTDLYKTSRSFGYKDLFTFSSDYDDRDSSVITVGIGLNGVNRDDVFKCFLEFNPNKVDVDILCMVIDTLHPNCTKHWLKLVRWDLAVDIPVQRSQACFYKDRRDYAYYKSARKGVTTYLGQRNKEGFTKLYDKTLESGLAENLTRLEITFGEMDLPTMPQVYIDTNSQEELLLNLSGTNRVLALLLNQLDAGDFETYYNMLNYKLKKKLEPYVKHGVRLEYDFKVIYSLMMRLKALEKNFDLSSDWHNIKFMDEESPFGKGN